jgi:hypothetical protein
MGVATLQTAANGSQANDQAADRTPMICEVFYRAMDTSRLLLAFLAFGAACTTLWAWMLATTGSTPRQD